jgi:hypothetical protein
MTVLLLLHRAMATTQETTRSSLAPLRLPELAFPHRDPPPHEVAEAGGNFFGSPGVQIGLCE